jgi:fatty acid desaturase
LDCRGVCGFLVLQPADLLVFPDFRGVHGVRHTAQTRLQHLRLLQTCTMGFGRLSAWFFGKRSNKDTRNKGGLAMVVIIYGLLAVIPAALLAFLILQSFSALKVAALISVLAFSLYSAATWRKSKVAKPPASTQ